MGNVFENGVPVDLAISLSPKTYVYLGGTIVLSVVAGYMLTRLLSRVK